jgi:5-methylcytosine-specific restriction endonuclease McrA
MGRPHLNLGIRLCECCEKPMILKIKRDEVRKKFCSMRCRQIGRWKRGEMTWWKQAMSASHTPEANKKKSHPGVLHPRYITDRTLLKHRHRYEHSEWRSAVFSRDNYTCQECGIRGKRMCADHIKPWCRFPEFRFDIANGRTLCESCHRQTPTYGAKALHALC